MKKILFLLIACFMLGASAPLSTASAQTQTTTTATVASDTLRTDSLLKAQLAQSENTIQQLNKKIDRLKSEQEDNGDLVPIVSIIAVFGLPFFLIVIYFYFRWKSQRAKLETFNKMVDSGQTISPESYRMLVEGLSNKKKNLTQTGIRTFFTGIGLSIFFYVTLGMEMASVGIFVVFIGIGEFVAGYFNKKDKEMLDERKDDLTDKQEQPAEPTEQQPTSTPNEQ